MKIMKNMNLIKRMNKMYRNVKILDPKFIFSLYEIPRIELTNMVTTYGSEYM